MWGDNGGRSFANEPGGLVLPALGDGRLLGVAADAVFPTGEPAAFVAVAGGIFHSALEDGGGGFGELSGGVAGSIHDGKDLHEAPAFAFVAFLAVGAFAFEIDVVDEGEGTGAGLLEAGEVFPDFVAIGRGGGGHDLRQGGAHASGQEAALEADAGGEEFADFLETGALEIGHEFGAGFPGAIALEPGGSLDAVAAEEFDELGEALFEWTFNAFRVPNEVADAEGGEVFTGIPRSEAVASASALVLPDAAPDLLQLSVGQRVGSRGGERGEEDEGEKWAEHGGPVYSGDGKEPIADCWMMEGWRDGGMVRDRWAFAAWRLVVLFGIRVFLLAAILASSPLFAGAPFVIQVVDAETNRPVPLVELETTDHSLYVTDSAGRVAFDEPGLMDQAVWFHIRSHGYEYAADGFGMRGARLMVKAGERAALQIQRKNIAERLVRLTGVGIYRDSILAGETVPLDAPLISGGVVGQDATQAVVYRDRIFWLWGDTQRLSYPLGNFRTTGAWSELPGHGGLPPSSGVNYRYLVGSDGFAGELCPLERKEGVVWLDGLSVVPDERGVERLVACYTRREGLGKIFERGIAIFDDGRHQFERLGTIPSEDEWRRLSGHPYLVRESQASYFYCGESGAITRVPARLSALIDPGEYEAWTCIDPAGNPRRCSDGSLDYAWRSDAAPVDSEKEKAWLKQGLIRAEECRVHPLDPNTGDRITLQHGTVRWNEYRQRWVLIASQIGAKSSMLGEVWYAEASGPTGPWSRAVKIVTHDRYTFYNPVHHPFFDEDGGRFIYFEGTYTADFSGNPQHTPRYDYNQILYRLDLADARLKLP